MGRPAAAAAQHAPAEMRLPLFIDAGDRSSCRELLSLIDRAPLDACSICQHM